MDLVSVFTIILIAVVYSWAIYNIPLLVVGVRKFRREKREGVRAGKRGCSGEHLQKDLPSFSVLIPARNEEKVLPRLFRAVLNQNYPREKLDVIVVEDGSSDGTVKICKEFIEKNKGLVRLIHGDRSRGKPSALNRGLKAAQGDIVAVFDADNIPEEDALSNAAKYFEDESVVALQGRMLTINSEVNMLTKFVSYEEAAWCEAYLRGRDALDLFVHLRGTCEFVRREVLERVGGWREDYLSDDFEMSARLTEKGYRIRYAPDVRSWQESPQGLRDMFHQRARWFRGAMEVALSYGRLMRKPSRKTLDAEVTLLAPFVLILSLLSYIFGPLTIYNLGGSILLVISAIGWALLTATIFAGALALLYVARPKKISDLLWAPFIYAYWTFQVFLATWALTRIVFRKPKHWKKTPRNGTITMTEGSSHMQSD